MGALLGDLRAAGHELALWTHSERPRAIRILRDLGLGGHFAELVCREDYDPDDRGERKDVRKIGGAFLVDDSPEEIEHARSLGVAAFRISSWRRGSPPDMAELEELRRAAGRSGGWLRRLLG
jgi:FMN phosphatase YigB (HAD superfamily)